MRRFFTITFLTVLLAGFLPVSYSHAENTFTQVFNAVPYAVSLSNNLDNITFNYDLTSLREDIELVAAEIRFSQIDDSEGDVILKLYPQFGDTIIGAISGVNSGEKKYSFIEDYLDIEDDSVSFKIAVEGIEEDSSVKIDDMRLVISYKIIDEEAPEILDSIVEDITEDSAIIKWTLSEDVGGVVRYGKTSNYTKNQSFEEVEVVGLEDEEKTEAYSYSTLLLNLSPGTTYHYQIIVEDESGNVSKTQDMSFITEFDGLPGVLGVEESELPKVTNVRGELFLNDENYEFEISWDLLSGEGVEKYYIYRQKNAEPIEKYAEVDGETSSYTDMDLEKYAEYTYIIRANKDIELSPKSDQLKVKVVDENLSTDETTRKYIDVAKVVGFVMAVTIFVLIIGYFFGKRALRFFKEVFTLEKKKNPLKDPDFIKKEFDKSND